MFAIHFLNYIQNVKKHYLWLITIVISLVITEIVMSALSLIFHGAVTTDYLITGVVVSILMAFIVSGMTIYFLRKLSDLNGDNKCLAEVINASPIPIAIYDIDHNIVMINREFTRIYGYTIDAIPTLDDWQRIAYPDEDYRHWVKESWALRSKKHHEVGRELDPLELKIHCMNGATKSVIATITDLEEYQLGLKMLVLCDTTESASISQAVVKSHNILQSVIETIPFPIYWKDKNLRYLGSNTAFANDAGETCPENIIGKLDSELRWTNHSTSYEAGDLSVIQSGQSKLPYEEAQTSADGEAIWLRKSKSPLLDDVTGETLGLLGIYEDITKQKEIEDRLWLTQTFFDKCSTVFFHVSPNGDLLHSNQYACEILGYTNEELLGMHPWDLDSEYTESAWAQAWEIQKERGTVVFETRYRRKDGTIHDVEVTSHYILYNGQEFSFTLVQNISERKQATQTLSKKEGYQRALIDNFPFAVWLKDTESRFLAVNQVLSDSLGLASKDDLVGKNDFDIASRELAVAYREDDLRVMESREQKIVEEIVEHDKQTRWVETFKAPVIDETGDLLGTVGFSRNISKRKFYEAELRIAAIAFESQEGMIITDADTLILKINHAFTRITGYTEKDAVGYKMQLLKSGIQDANFYADIWKSIHDKGSWQGEIWNQRKNGEIYPAWLTITAVKDEDDNVTHHVATMLDITSRKEIEREVQHLAHHDALTDLPNRTLLTDRLNQALAHVRREDSKLAIMFLDLDNFKPVNDSLGHDMGDLVLKEVADRLRNCVKRQSDTVSRIGGDEFVVLLPRIDNQSDVEKIAHKILDAINTPFNINNHTINISTSIGIAIYPTHGIDANSLMKNADNAMYQAKDSGRSCFKFFTEESNNQKPE